jgi:hypothetical protein
MVSFAKILEISVISQMGGVRVSIAVFQNHHTTPSSGVSATFSPWKGERRDFYCSIPSPPGYGGEG